MKFKNIFKKAAVLAAAITLMSVGMCSALEVNILDEEMKDVYKNSKLQTNWWGKAESSFEAYAKGEAWATSYGMSDGAADTEYGLGLSLCTINADGSKPSSSQEVYLTHLTKEKIELPENPSYKVTIDFRMGKEPKAAISSMWFYLEDKVSNGANIFKIHTQRGQAPYLEFASTTRWPFTPKAFDRSRGMEIEYDKDYRVVMEIKPYKGTYRFAAYLYDGEGNELGAGIIERYDMVNATNLCHPNKVTIMTKAGTTITEQEIFVHLKHIKVEASASEKPSVLFGPANGALNVKPDGEFSAVFERAVEPIKKENVTVSGGAAVDSVEMSEDGKKAVFAFSGLKYGKTYNVKITDAKTVGDSEGYELDWSFTTAKSVSVSEFSFAKDEIAPANINFAALKEDDLTDNAADEEYIKGSKFFISPSDSFKNIVNLNDGDLGLKASGGKTNAVIKKNINFPYKDERNIGAELDFSAKRFRWYNYAAATVSLCADDSRIIDLLKFEIPDTRRWSLISVLKPANAAGYAENATVAKDGDFKLKISIIPNGDVYDLSLALTMPNGTVKENMITGALSKDEVSAINNVSVEFEVDSGTDDLGEVFGIKSLNIATEGGAKLKNGDNAFFADYENLAPEEEFSAEVLVLVEDKASGIIQSVNKTGVSNLGESGQIEVHAEVSDAENQRVRILLLNNTNDMILFSKASLIGN